MTTDGKKIALIDDDAFLLDMYSIKFERNGYSVDVFTNPKQILQKIEEGYSPDIVLSDLVMPGIDGWGFIDKLRNGNLLPKSKVIVLSNQNQEDDVEKAKKYDVDGYIVKALATPSEVVLKVKEIVSGSKQQPSVA